MKIKFRDQTIEIPQKLEMDLDKIYSFALKKVKIKSNETKKSIADELLNSINEAYQ